MHLNDDELLEPNPQSKLHLSQCASCQQRADKLETFRQQLICLPIKKMPHKNWHQIQKALEPTGKQVVSINNGYQPRSIRWGLISAALAASLLLVVLMPQDEKTIVSTTTQEQILANLIKQNNLLQEKLLSALAKNENYQQELASIRYQINQLDGVIQNAYLQQLPEKELTELWNNKLVLLQKHSVKAPDNNLIKI